MGRPTPSPPSPTPVLSFSDSKPLLTRVTSSSLVVLVPAVAVVAVVRKDPALTPSPREVAAREERLLLTTTSSPPYDHSEDYPLKVRSSACVITCLCSCT